MNEKVKKDTKTAIWPMINTALILAVFGAGYVAINENSAFKANQFQIKALENKIAQLENVVRSYQSKSSTVDAKDVAALNEKIDHIAKVNLELLDAKAGLAAVSGVTERVDRLELEIGKLGQVSSESALILTAAGLVEEAAKKHEPFIYEASVLEGLSHDTPMEKSAHIIAGIAVKGLPSNQDLIEKFIKIYELSFLSQRENKVQDSAILASDVHKAPQTWTEKLAEKLKTLVVIEKIKEPTEKTVRKDVDEVYRLVRNGDFETAIVKMNTDPKYQTENFEIWIEDVRAEKVFDKEMAKIKSMTLGAMKLENLK
ncbi:MAG: hypothetical protein IJ870_04355 [Alphaproteobacteria bacterium]|nr:hypothetical protein [Alphaproteobacteria bacterium]